MFNKQLLMHTKELGVSLSLYVDDAAIYCSNYDSYFVEVRLESALNCINKWCHANSINQNVNKT